MTLIGTIAAGLLIPAGAAQAASPSPATHRTLAQATSAAHQKHAVSTLSAGNWEYDVTVGQTGGTLYGCAYGDACLYTDSGANTNTPEHSYRRYQCYNLSNEYGHRYLFNNQYDGATVTLYTGYNCSGPTFTSQQADIDDGDITPINSISLNP